MIGNPRGIGKSEGGGSRAFDSYDLIEWIAAQPWCDGNVGMVGISGFGAEQFMAAKQQPPHLKAIFPFDPRGAYGEAGGFREEYPGGVIHLFRFLLQVYASAHQQKGQPKRCRPNGRQLWQQAIANPDFKMYPHVYNVLALKGQHFPAYFDILIDPYDKEEAVKKSEAEFSRINIPTYTGSGWYGYTYKTHLAGAQSWFRNIDPPRKKLLLAGPAHLDRPVKAFHNEMLRWYDQWLKGIDTGILDDPPVRFWVMGANEWRSASDWPLPETEWIKFYLRGWERLTTEPFAPASADDYQAPDAFAQMPASQTSRIQKLRYLSEPLAEDVTIAGPSVLNLYAAIDQDDTNWIVILKDVGPDVGVQTAREGERDVTPGLHERELTRGWLKASHRALDPTRSLPGRPWHPLTRAAQKPVVPGAIEEYAIEIMATANRFNKGHRICVEITSLDVGTGVGSATNVEYIPYHICSSKTVLHKVYHDPDASIAPLAAGDSERMTRGTAQTAVKKSLIQSRYAPPVGAAGRHQHERTPHILAPKELPARLHLFQQPPLGDRLPDPRHFGDRRTADLFRRRQHSGCGRSLHPAEGADLARAGAVAPRRRGRRRLRRRR